ncbi:membrane protease activity protein [Synechococcus phage S-CRES1]|nr:membrane protease activity protein [Synechococcus phage S-CRES1]
MILETLKQISLANRVTDLERLSSDTNIQGDFEGSVTGYWVKLGQRGEGIVKYNSKEYKTKPIGFVAATEGREVELTFANGVYYSKF